MQTADTHIDRINSKLQELIRKYNLLVKENEQKSRSLATLQQQKETTENRIKELEQQNTVLKAACGNMGASDKKEFEQTVSKYIRDVDKCISLLSE